MATILNHGRLEGGTYPPQTGNQLNLHFNKLNGKRNEYKNSNTIDIVRLVIYTIGENLIKKNISLGGGSTEVHDKTRLNAIHNA